MIHSLSKMITNFLISREMIHESEADVFVYGYETICSGIIDLIMTMILGMLFNNLIAAAVFFIMFVSVRMYSGGYHANSYLKCKLIFIAISVTVIVSSYVKIPIFFMIMIISLFLGTMFFLCPIENPNKLLSEQQKRKYRVIGILLSIFWSITAIITYFNITSISMVILSSEFFITLLMFMGNYGKED